MPLLPFSSPSTKAGTGLTKTGSILALTTPVTVPNGGTGQTTYINGQLLIGNTTGNTLTKATLTGTANQITVTNGTGSITLSTPQDIATVSSPTFVALTLSGASVFTSASAANVIPLTINQNDTTNNPTGLKVSNTGSGVTLDLPSVNIAASSTTANLRIFTTDTATLDFGGSIALGGYYNGTTTQIAFAGIAGRKENATANNTRGYLQFLTDGAEAGRFDSNKHLTLKGIILQYNTINTVSNGVPSELATIDTTGLTANVGASTLYAVPASGAGMYRVSAYVVLTTAGSVSSTLPNIQIVYTDSDSNTSVTIDATPVLGVAGTGQTGALTANTVGTVDAGVIVIYVKASTTIQYKTVNYASTAGGMTYALRIKLEAM